MSVSVPNLLAYDDPAQRLTASLRAAVGPLDALLVFPSAPGASYLPSVLEKLEKRPACLFFIGFDRVSEFALWSDDNFPVREIGPREYVELQLAAANLFLLLVEEGVSVPVRAPVP